MTLDTLGWIVASLALAGFLQGISGFGFGMTAGALLPLLMNVREAQAVVTVVSIITCGVNFAVTYRHFEWWSGGLLLLAGAWLGVPLGFAFLTAMEPEVIKRCLGAALCGMVLFEWLVVRRRGLVYPGWISPWVGMASGLLTGAFNIGGPPLVAYMYGRPWTKQRTVATLSLIFLASGLMRMALLVQADDLTPGVWTPAAWAVPPTLAAVMYGNHMLGRMSQRHLRLGVYIVLLLLGARYLITGS